QLPEDEIAYLTLHFQASVERREKKNHQKKQGIIVCHLGVGTSHLLQAKLEQQFKDIDIIACIGEAELQPYLSSAEADFRSEEHTSELQSRFDLVCRLLLEKKNKHRQ